MSVCRFNIENTIIHLRVVWLIGTCGHVDMWTCGHVDIVYGLRRMFPWRLIKLRFTTHTMHITRTVMTCIAKTPIYTGTETDTHAHCIPGRVAGRNDLSYIVNSGKTHCK